MSSYAAPSELTAIGMEMVFNPRYGLRALAVPPVFPASTWFGANLPTPPAQFTTTSSPPSAANTNRGSYYTPGTGGDSGLTLQAALTAAAGASGTKGDVIVLQAGTTYTTTSSFTLPARSGSGWIYIISSDAPEISGAGLPAAGIRVGPANISDMASLRTSGANGGYLIETAAAANHYRLVGIDIELTDANAEGGINYYTIYLPHSDTATSTLATDVTFDRCYISGAPNLGVEHALQIDGIRIEVTECYIERVWSQGNADNQCIVGWGGTGPYRIYNCWLNAMGEITLWGGADTNLPSPNMSSDILIENCHYYKPILVATGSVDGSTTTLTIASVTSGSLYPTMLLQDSAGNVPPGIASSAYIVKQLSGTTGGSGTYQMSAASTSAESSETINAVSSGKNMFEFKCAQRVLINSCFFENAGAEGQARSAFVLTARNQDSTNPWNTVSDIALTNSIFTNAQFGGINMLLQDSTSGGTGPTQPGYRILIRNNLFLMCPLAGGSDTAMTLCAANLPPAGNGGGQGGDVIFDHNTFIDTTGLSGETIWWGAGSANMTLVSCVWSNNIYDVSKYGIAAGGGPATYATAIPPQTTDPAFLNNVLVGYSDASLPSTNFKPANHTAVGFTSYGSVVAAAGYVLASGSYKGAGLSGAGLAYNAAGTADGTDIGCNISLLPTS